MSDTKYSLSYTPRGYFTKISADLLPSVTTGTWLTAGSQNMLIDEDGTLSTRKGMSIIGAEGENGGVQWADTWTTNTNSERAMRTIFDTLQVKYEDEWYDVKTGFGNNTYFCGGSWWDKNENMDKYVFVNNSTKIYSWQGGITRVASRVSGSSLKKENGGTPTSKSILITAGTSITWGYPIGTQNNVTRNSLSGTVANFWDAGFRAGDTISVTVTGIAGSYTIASVNTANNEILITGDFGAEGTSTTVGQGVVGTVNAYGPLAKTWAQERFQTNANKRFVMLGVVYTYTGGENTDTLTGITPSLPAVIADGTLVFSDIVEATPSGGDYASGSTPDILTVARNQVYIADGEKNWVWISKQDDYTSYTYTTPVRINGEGGSARLDKNVVAVATNDTDNSVRVSCGTDTWYPITFQVASTSTTPGELVIVGAPKKGAGVGANNQFSVCNTKQGMMYLSQEPTFDYLQNVLQFNQVVLPVGDPISTDLQNLDLTGAKTLYWRNYVWLLLPAEGRMYAYDMIMQLWQPPQIVAGNCLSIIDGWLAVHSSVKNETYKMFDGTNDNGNPISFIGVMSYQNGGRRDAFKYMDGLFVEAKVTAGTDAVTFGVNLGYKGSGGNFNTTFGSDDGLPFVDSVALPPGFGGSSFGSSPFGSFFTSDEVVNYKKVRKILPLIKNGYEFFEFQCYFTCDALDSQFKVLAHGSNMELSGSHNGILMDTQ